MSRRIVCAILVVLSLVSWGAAAQQPARPDSAAGDTTLAYPLPPVIVTGVMIPVVQDHVGFASTVVSREELRAHPVPYAATALARLPGVSIDEAAGPAGPTVIRLRGGEEPFTQVMFDGVPINISGGFLDLQGLTLTNVDRIEVARGPHGVLYGSSAISGVVHLITRRGEPGPPQLELTAEGGKASEHGQQGSTQVNAAGGSQALRYAAGLGTTYSRGVYALPHDLVSHDLSLRVDAVPNARVRADATVRYMDIESKLPVRDAGVTRAPLDSNQRDARQRRVISAGAQVHASSAWRHTLSASTFRDDFYYEDQQDGIDPTLYPFFVFDFNFSLRSVLDRHSFRYIGTHLWSAPSGPGSAALSYGAEVEYEDLTDDQAGDFGDSRTAFDRSARAAFAEVEGTISHLAFLVGARLQDYEGLDAEVLPQASLRATLVPEWLALRGSVGRAFKAPNLQQQLLQNPFTEPNPNLRPETSVSWEIGTAVTTPDRRFTASAGLFHQTNRDLIRTVALAGTTKQTNENLGRSRAVGVEMDVDYVWPGGRASLNVTRTDTEILDNTGLPAAQYPVGSTLPATPAFTGSVLVEGELGERLTIGLRGSVIGRQTVFTERFSGARVELDPYGLVGITARLALSDAIGVHARIENLLNTRYTVAFDRPGAPLTALVGFRIAN